MDIHPVADEKMGNEFAHLLNLSEEAIAKIEKENYRLKKENEKLKVDKMARMDSAIDRMAQRPMMTDEDCDKIIELCWWHLGTCELADCIIDSCDIMKGDEI